jgi:hypothetical protein
MRLLKSHTFQNVTVVGIIIEIAILWFHFIKKQKHCFQSNSHTHTHTHTHNNNKLTIYSSPIL